MPCICWGFVIATGTASEEILQRAIITYDWSGNYALQENRLEVTLKKSGNDILLIWNEENGSREVELTATLIGNALLFHSDSWYFRKDRLLPKNQFNRWTFLSATLQYSNIDEQILLSGNLHTHVCLYRIHGQPSYFILQLKEPFITGIIASNTSDESDEMSVEILIFDQKTEDETPLEERAEPLSELKFLIYPIANSNMEQFNPFTDFIGVQFELEEESDCVIEIYSMSGELVAKYRLGLLKKGVHNHRINVGTYIGDHIIKITCGNKSGAEIFSSF